MDIKDIKDIVRFLKGTDIVEFELEDSRGKVRLKRKGAEIASQTHVHAVQQKTAEKEEAKPAEEKKSNLKIVTSPMVGTFYRAASPENPAFVEIGSSVRSGQVVCIIEAMKIMNEVESEHAGKVAAVLVENGQPVEYGEPLFQIEG